jgi:hypothetical protein
MGSFKRSPRDIHDRSELRSYRGPDARLIDTTISAARHADLFIVLNNAVAGEVQDHSWHSRT